MIRVVVDDLASFAADALVRPATTRLDPTAAALRRLEIVGGQEFRSRIRLSRELAVGAAVVTAAGGELPAEFVIHAVIRSETEPVTRGSVAQAWLSTLHQAQEWQFAHVSAPPLGTGAGNLTLEDAAEIMATLLQAHRAGGAGGVGGGGGGAQFPADVSFVVKRAEDQQVFEAALQRAV